ncbi:MAG: hypothetical protein OXM61_11045 [Candidatus Poribacteria bacterium]|nr:hypothetical protein [Candidatus Poribacteria bacterium]
MNKTLSDLFHVKGRFLRSVHLERDFYTDRNLLEGYVVTATAREVLGRVVSALENNQVSKAWSLTGPYGSGKSAFALFTANLLGNSEQALTLLEQGDTSLYKRFTDINANGRFSSSGFCPVLISGERAPISIALLQGLEHGLTAFNGIPRNYAPLPKIRTLLNAAKDGTLPHSTEITEIFTSATRQIKKQGGTGLFLVIDELGKFLEYATHYPAQGDMFVLQTLAEFADRSGETPLLLLTVLHQAFELYAEHAVESQREEWAKVQGRFEDVPFTEPIEQVLRLVGTALENRTQITGNVNFNSVIELGLKTQQLDDNELIQLLENCLPLHPTVALLIGPLFRRFAQNERSLFAFLSSSEPHGLQDFLSNRHYDGNQLPMFALPDLYDYLNITQGNKLYTSSNSKKWAQIESAIMQLSEPSSMTVKLIKTIGLLGIVSEPIPNLKASDQLLRYALDDGTEGFNTEFAETLAILKNRSIISHRLYNDTYVLWGGSDIDIEAKLDEAETHVDRKVALDTNLSRYMPTRPLVARRHLFETGTLRHFTVRYTNFENFDANLTEPHDGADGLILYALPANKHETEQLHKKAEKATRKEALIAIPNAIGFLQEAIFEVARLRWIEQNTPELQKDDVARRELSARLLEAEMDVSRQLKAIFDEDNENTCSWYYKGELQPIRSHKARNVYLTDICKQIYSKTPIIRNELINRRKISGTITAARRELIQAMLEKGDQENLGIKGYPPEMSIYRSLLRSTEMHRHESHGVWKFHPPPKRGKNRMYPTWKEIEKFLRKCESQRQPVEKLYKRLMKPPFGVRSGPLPILLCAAMLHYRTEVALYENGSFIPDLSMPIFERLLKAPDRFELKRFQITDHRTSVLEQYLDVLDQTSNTDTLNLLAVATPFMLFVARLPKYTLTTQTLSKNAKNLRKVVVDAREPDTLLFHDLPKVMGFPPFSAESDNNTKTDQFFKILQNTLDELKQAYPSLLNSIEQQIASNFSLEYKGKKLRRELTNIAKPLEEVTRGTQLTPFLLRICDSGLDLNSWLEAIATSIVNKAPTSWIDTDIEQFEINLSQLTRKFRHFEVLYYEKRKHAESTGTKPIRIGTTKPNANEQERVVTLPPADENQANEMVHEIQDLIDKLDMDRNSELRLWVLAQIVEKEMQQRKEHAK